MIRGSDRIVCPPRPPPPRLELLERERETHGGRRGKGEGGVGVEREEEEHRLWSHDWSRSRNLHSPAWSFQGIHERAFSLALQSWLAKFTTLQPGLALVELNKPGSTEEALANLDLPLIPV